LPAGAAGSGATNVCGIGGIVYWDGRTPRQEDLTAIVRAQHHRGPDGDGIWTGGRAALAHNRLAIIDLCTGQQPMTWAEGRFVLTYNGELYNFLSLRAELEQSGARFRTSSDTEVVLAAYERWGRSCVERFRGMYAFAIWDTAAQELFVARDRLGIKPLFYCQTPDFFAFSSELQGVLSVPGVARSVDLGALDLYLHYQYIPAPFTIYNAVRKLEPAHALLLRASGSMAAPHVYWRLRFAPDRSPSEGEWLERLDHEIGESVKAHLVSDVPFGAFLSGGIDSSIVAYHMSRHLSQPVKTFTIGFDEAAYDERDQARAVADTIGSDHRCEVVYVDKYDVLDDLIDRLARHYGEPFADSSAIPTYCVSAMARSQVKMVLSGDGGDELFAGYNTYPNILRAVAPPSSWWRRFRSQPFNGDGLRERALAPPGPAALAEYGRFYAYFDDERRAALYRPEVRETVTREDHHALYRQTFGESGGADCLSALQYLDIKTYLPHDILAKVDVASMYSSLEVRVPLLDHHVVELAARIPPEMKLFAPDGTLQQKYLLKKYVNRLLPGDAFTRPKQGFGVPIDRWFGGDLYTRVHQRLTESGTILSRLFDPAAVRSLVATPAAAQANAPRVWSLLFLRAWSDVFSIAL
jgi:asparagine synthase (glutamine-hydrolysing)